jgi:putative transport protein
MQWMVETLRHYPEIAIFLALALGFVIGPIKLGKFSLGNVTGVLLVGVLIGQLEITISSSVKSVFFLMLIMRSSSVSKASSLQESEMET